MVCCEAKSDLIALAERVRVSFAEVSVAVDGGFVAATVSVGVALWSERASVNYLDLLALADDRMYAAKMAGRNGVWLTASPTRVRPIDAYAGTK